MKDYKVSFPKESATAHLLMTPLGNGQYRLEETPVLLEEPLFFRDIIQASRHLGRGLNFQQLVEKSGLRVYDFLLPLEVAGSEELQVFLRRIKGDGGHWEVVFGGIVIIHLPPASALDPEKEIQLLAVAEELHPALAVSTPEPRRADATFDLR